MADLNWTSMHTPRVLFWHEKGLGKGLLGYELLEGVGDENSADVKVQASLLVVVIVQHALRWLVGDEEDAAEFDIALALEVSMCQWLRSFLHRWSTSVQAC